MSPYVAEVALLCGVVAGHGPSFVRQLAFDRTPSGGEYKGQSARRLRSQDAAPLEWEPIRIYTHTEHLREDVPDEEDRAYLTDGLLQAAVRWLAGAVRVRPVLGRLRFVKHCSYVISVSGECAQVASDFQKCGDATIPNEHFRDRKYCSGTLLNRCDVSRGGPGISNADVALYVTARDTSACDGTAVAYAGACRQDDTDRPVAGYINFCKSRVLARRDWYTHVAMTVHEILHTLAFASTLFAFFRDEGGAPRTPRDASGMPPLDHEGTGYRAADSTVLRTRLDDGTRKHYVVLPRVLEAARRYYNCVELDRVPLEEAGGEGAAFSHWDERAMHTEVMAPYAGNYPRLSSITLALLDDSGWYRPDYDHAGEFKFGYGKGCRFLTERCVNDGVPAFPDTFCSEAHPEPCGQPSSAVHCTAGLMGKAVCTACVHPRPLPPKFRYFDDSRLGGDRHALAFCPVWDPYATAGGELSFCQKRPSSGLDPAVGESFGTASRCIMSTAVKRGYMPFDVLRGTCREVECTQDQVRIRFGQNRWVTCGPGDAGKRKSAGGKWLGDVQCPRPSDICGERGDLGPRSGAKPCMFPGTRRHGRCVCPPGAIHEDCSVTDTAANRPSYPFGLRYAQGELALLVGVSLAMSPGVENWPLRPKIASGPSLLTFSVAPALPEGLHLDAADGTLMGTPTGAVPRSHYVVRASCGEGAATTTLLITVTCVDGQACRRAAVDDGQAAPGAAAVDAANATGSPEGQSTCSTSVAAPGVGAPGAPEASGLVRLALLGRVRFRAIQKDPGLQAFAAQLASALRAAVGIDVVVSNLAALSSGHVVAELHPVLPGGLPVDSATLDWLVGKIVGELQEDAGALQSSDFGQRYLGDVELYQVTAEGTWKIWPPPAHPEDSVFDILIGGWRSWLPLVALSLVTLSVALGCIETCHKKSQRSETPVLEPEGSPASTPRRKSCLSRISSAASALAVVSVAVLVGDRLWTWYSFAPADAQLPFGLEPWQALAFLCATLLFIFSFSIRPSEEDRPSRPLLSRLSTASYVLALALLAVVVLYRVWPELMGDESLAPMMDMPSWERWALCAVFFSTCFLISVFSGLGRRREQRPEDLGTNAPAAARHASALGVAPPTVVGTPLNFTAASDFTDEALTQMLDMGFDPEAAVSALREHGGDVAGAAVAAGAVHK